MTWPAPTIYTHEFYLSMGVPFDERMKWGPTIPGCPGTGADATWDRVVRQYEKENN